MKGTNNNQEIQATVQEQIGDVEKFDKLGVNDKLLRGIFSYGYEHPSAIQQKAILPLMKGRDLIAQAQSGTGKTGAFAIGVLHQIDLSLREPQALILSPTRELANQTYDVCMGISKHMDISIVQAVGGTSVADTADKLRRGAHVVVGTPGRVRDMLGRQALKPHHMKILILDEADEMLARDFKDQIYDVFQFLPSTIQVGLFSATMPDGAKEISQKIMRNPVQIYLKNDQLALMGIRQYYVNLENEEWKLDVLYDIYETINVNQSIIFCNSRRKAEDISAKLRARQFIVSCTHGELTQPERNEILKEFKLGKNARVLVTTDLLSRGIDIQQISLVINYELPENPATYMHRMGRGGRFGRKGTLINLCYGKEMDMLRDLQLYYNTQIEEMPGDLSKIV